MSFPAESIVLETISFGGRIKTSVLTIDFELSYFRDIQKLFKQ